MTYEQLQQMAYDEHIIIEERPLKSYQGLCYGNLIFINSSLPTQIEKSCVLAEELGHYYTTVGDILDQTVVMNRKQEYRARLWGYNHMIGLYGIISAAKAGCKNRYEVAEHLEVKEEFLAEALRVYESKFGTGVVVDNYWVMFTPYLQVFEYRKIIRYIKHEENKIKRKEGSLL